MAKKTSPLVVWAFPLGLLGTVAKSYYLKLFGDENAGIIDIWSWILIGIVSAICLVGFLLVVHFKLFAIPIDLFTGPLFGKGGPVFAGNPSIFRQAVVYSFCLAGCGVGYAVSAPIFKVDTLGIGLNFIIIGFAGILILIVLWRGAHKNVLHDK